MAAPKSGSGVNVKWSAAYYPDEAEGWLQIGLAYTFYGQEQPQSGQAERRVTWTELRKRLRTGSYVTLTLDITLASLMDAHGLASPWHKDGDCI